MTSTNREPASCQQTDHTVRYGGGTIHARCWTPASSPSGSSDDEGLAPIVLMHDSLGAVSLWRGLPKALAIATGRRVVAYDRLGFGESSAIAALPDPGFIAAEARGGFSAVVDQLGIERFVVMGHSVGGGMSIEIAAQWPGRCDALITIAAQTFLEERTLAGVRASREDFRAPGQIDRLRRYHGDKAPWVLNAWTERWLAPDFAGWSLRAVLPCVGCPVLTIHGELDEYGSPAHQDLIAALVAGPVTRLTMAGLGHGPHREAQAEVIDAIAAFLARLR